MKTTVIGLAVAFMAAVPIVDAPAQTRTAIEEVVVTATKRVESVQDVPIAVSAYSGDALQYRGITDINQLQQVSPSPLINTNGGTMRIRGIGTTEVSRNGRVGVNADPFKDVDDGGVGQQSVRQAVSAADVRLRLADRKLAHVRRSSEAVGRDLAYPLLTHTLPAAREIACRPSNRAGSIAPMKEPVIDLPYGPRYGASPLAGPSTRTTCPATPCDRLAAEGNLIADHPRSG